MNSCDELGLDGPAEIATPRDPIFPSRIVSHIYKSRRSVVYTFEIGTLNQNIDYGLGYKIMYCCAANMVDGDTNRLEREPQTCGFALKYSHPTRVI